MTKKKLKLGKKTRNTISGLMVGLASIFAVSTYMEIPLEELRSFLLSTLLFFLTILVLALICTTVIKVLVKVAQKITSRDNKTDQPKDKE